MPGRERERERSATTVFQLLLLLKNQRVTRKEVTPTDSTASQRSDHLRKKCVCVAILKITGVQSVGGNGGSNFKN